MSARASQRSISQSAPCLLAAEAGGDAGGVLREAGGEVLDVEAAVGVPAEVGAVDAALEVEEGQLGAAVEAGGGQRRLADQPGLVGGLRGVLGGELAGAPLDEFGEVVGQEGLRAEAVLEGVAGRAGLALGGLRAADALARAGRARRVRLGSVGR